MLSLSCSKRMLCRSKYGSHSGFFQKAPTMDARGVVFSILMERFYTKKHIRHRFREKITKMVPPCAKDGAKYSLNIIRQGADCQTISLQVRTQMSAHEPNHSPLVTRGLSRDLSLFRWKAAEVDPFRMPSPPPPLLAGTQGRQPIEGGEGDL